MENEIKVGDWIRTNWGHIGKLKRVELDKIDKGLKWYVFDHKEFEINIIKEEYINKPYIVKHSPNLIDLIQCGDVIKYWRNKNLYKDEVWQVDLENKAILNNEGDLITFDSIDKIYTKEMMESISYKVKQEEN